MESCNIWQGHAIGLAHEHNISVFNEGSAVRKTAAEDIKGP